MAIVYKILCEVKLMHEYYLTSEKGETVFDFAAQNDRMNFLFQQFVKDLPSINNNLDFVISKSNQVLFNNLKIKIIPSYSGFKLAIQCNKKILADGTTVYEPVTPLPIDTAIPVFIKEEISISSFSNNTLKKPFNAAWYFTNQDFPSAKTFPFLSNSVPVFDGGASYQQGEIALHGSNDVRAFLNNGAIDPWLKLKGTGYINESDKLLLPLSFSYTFSTTDNVTDALFILKDFTNTEVKRLSVSGANPIKSVYLNFHTENNIVKTLTDAEPAANNIYTLEVTGSNGYSKTFTPLLFADESMGVSNYTALLQFKPKADNAAFNLIDSNGFLFTRILPDSTKQPPPVFELWMKSRLVFWQYVNNKQRKIKLTIETQDLLTENSGVLVMKNPISLTYSPILVKKPDNSFQYLPNPLPGDLITLSINTFFVNILVPESKMFPLA